MSEEKVRVSGEIPRGAESPILPTVNPDVEKVQVQKGPKGLAIHPAFYVV